MKNELYPILFTPIYKDYPWGGTRIPEIYGRKVPDGIYAESWEISDHADGESVIANGWMKGQTLKQALLQLPQQIMGTSVQGTSFPVLIKIIDARQSLSVQVHPDDAGAAIYGGEAKTEAWYLLGEDQTQVYCGFKESTEPAQFNEAVENGTCSELLRVIPVEKDSVIFVGGGSVHAIDQNCLIYEVQQNSNTTYRIYDWNRTGADGQPRELHVEQAQNIIKWDLDDRHQPAPTLTVDTETYQCWEVMRCDSFLLEKMMVKASQDMQLNGATFHALFISEGTAQIRWNNETMTVSAGTSILIPAGLKEYQLSGTATVLRTTMPE